MKQHFQLEHFLPLYHLSRKVQTQSDVLKQQRGLWGFTATDVALTVVLIWSTAARHYVELP